MGLLTDWIKRGWAQEDQAAELARQQEAAGTVKGLIGQAAAPYQLATPQQEQMSADPLAPVEVFDESDPILQQQGLKKAGTGYLGSLADVDPRAREMAQTKLYGGLLTTPGYEQIGAQGIQGLLGRQAKFRDTGIKPTGVMQNLLAAGYKEGTPEYQQAMKDYLSKAQTQINMGSKNIPVTDLMKMRMPDGSRPPVGLTYEQAQGLGVTLKKDLASDSASKLAMLDTARQGIKTIQPLIFKNGKIDRDLIKQAWAIGQFEPAAALASPEAGKIFAGMEYGIQAITRAETGAAMPATEIDNTRKRFMPKPWDSDEVVNQKWSAYQLFINNASKYINPKAAKSGQWGNAIDFDKLMSDVGTKTGAKPKGLIYQPKTMKFEDLK